MTQLTQLPTMPAKARNRKFATCECGCGGDTQRRFVPGHDSRLRGWILRVERDVVTLDWIAEHASEGEAMAVAIAMGRDWSPKVEQVG